jgi:hypothetical protein
MATTARVYVRCRGCGGRIVPDTRACHWCGVPGPHVRWPGRMEAAGWLAIGTPMVCGALGVGLAYLGGWMGNEVGDDIAFLGMMLVLLAAIVFLPALAIALAAGLSVRGAKGDSRPLAVWQVVKGEETYAVILPQFRVNPQAFVWVDGLRRRVTWEEADFGRSRAVLETVAFAGILRIWAEGPGAAIAMGGSAITGVAWDTPYRVALEVEGATVTLVESASMVA